MTSAPASVSKTNLIEGIREACTDLGNLIGDKGTLNYTFGLGECGGLPLAFTDAAGGGPVGGTSITWTNLLAEISKHATGGAQEVALLPKTAPPGLVTSYVSSAEEKAWGLMNPYDPGINGQVGFSNHIVYAKPDTSVPGQYDPYRIALHEITHGLGRIYGTGAFAMQDFLAPGVLANPQIGGGYLSWDDGKTNQGNLEAAPNDLADFVNGTTNDPFNYVTYSGSAATLSQRDIVEIGLLGFQLNHSKMGFIHYR